MGGGERRLLGEEDWARALVEGHEWILNGEDGAHSHEPYDREEHGEYNTLILGNGQLRINNDYRD